MATQEKLLKSLEILKGFSNLNQNVDATSRKKEKIQHCHMVTEAISNPTIKIAPSFNNLLSFTIEILLQLCDDPEADVRMTAEECLNRIIRALSDGNIGKVQIELHKEIKKNGSARSLRAALWRFAQLAHLIRPHKGKPYVANVLPSITKITERTEESIHETLAVSLPKIMQVLGCFTSESEIKDMLKSFFLNVSNQSSTIRRTTANCVLNICLNTRKPYVYIVYCISNILDSLSGNSEEQTNTHILGVMMSLKTVLPYLKKPADIQEIKGSFGTRKETDINPHILDRLIQVYEICLGYLFHKDHNVVNASLDTLNVLLQNSPPDLKEVLTSKPGLSKLNRNARSSSLTHIRSPSQLSVATTLASNDDNVLIESELTDTLRSDIEQWIDKSELSIMNVTYAKSKENISKVQSLSNSSSVNNSIPDLRVTDSLDPLNISKVTGAYTPLKSSSIEDHLDGVSVSDHSSDKSMSCLEDDRNEIDIGDIYDPNVSLIYCTRLISKQFLLPGMPGMLVSDKTVRVSVKSLALSCLSTILEIYPQAFLIYLDKNYDSAKNQLKHVSSQQISDILLFAGHFDPQLRGALRIIVANFLNRSLIESGGFYTDWLQENATVDDLSPLEMKKLVDILIKGLEDESSTCAKLTIMGLNICLKTIAESHNSLYILPLLDAIPALAANPYWLIKVALCDLISNLCYITIYHICGTNNFQNKVLHNVLFILLGDSDQRVRTAAANAITMVVQNLYFSEFQMRETATTTKAVYYSKLYLSNIYDCYSDEIHLNKKHFIGNMSFPYDCITQKPCDRQEFSLAKIISKLYHFILTSSSKHFMHGCIETLSLLCRKYPSTVYLKAWNCLKSGDIKLKQECRIPDVLSLCIDLLCSSVLVYDLTCHMSILNIALNLYAGYSVCVLIPQADVENTNTMWSMFSNNKFSELSESFLCHIVRLLNVFHHVVDESFPTLPHSKPVLPNLPLSNSLSPIKRRKSDLDKKMIQPGKHGERDEKSEKKEIGKANMLGLFLQSPHYMKIFEVLRMSYTNYKVSLESEASEKLLKLLEVTLKALSTLLEIGTLTEFGRISEEILSHLRFAFALDSVSTVECVQQLLKCLFGTNLAANVSELLDESSKKFEEGISEDNSGFYHNISQKPYNKISICINSLNNISKIDCDGDDTVMGYLHRRSSKQVTTFARSSDKVLANYIRIFEPMVIKSLKQYTLTSDIRLQSRVLQLLSQLVQLRVNYCLLDSEQVFIGFVLKQFEFIEEGQVPLVNELIPKIFQFLVQLSYSKQHSKSIIGVPKIIQLCDGLMASGQSPSTHCIPALKPIVEDIFLTRNKLNTSDMKELETTREVVLSMLLRLLEYAEIMDLIILILDDSKYYSDNPEKWLQWSQKIVSVLFPLLKQDKIKISNSKDFVSLRRLIFTLNPNVFKPVNEVITMIFQSVPDENVSLDIFQRWLGKILILLLILSSTKEDVIIAKITELRADFSPNSIFENVIAAKDPLNVINNAEIFSNLSPEVIFIRFLFRVITLVSHKIVQHSKVAETDFVVEEFSILLMYCLHIFQSGSHCKIANVAISLVNKNIPFEEHDVIQLETLNRNFLELAVSFPTLVFHWCYFLTLINYNNKDFWMKILNIPVVEKESNVRSLEKLPRICSCINYEIVRVGGTIVFCDYLSENLSDHESLGWMSQNNIDLLINLCDEPPVFEFFSCIHRNSTTSGLVLKEISKQCKYVRQAEFRTKVLKCIENSHPSQTGAVLCLLLPEMLNFHQVAVTRLVANLASRKIELLLTMSMEEVNNLLTREEVLNIIEQLVSTNLAKKHQGLVGLLNRLAVQYYDLSPIECDQKKSVNPEYIKRLQINRNWYLMQIKSKLQNDCVKKCIAEMLHELDEDELHEMMLSNDFSVSHLDNCMKYGLGMLRNTRLKESEFVDASVYCLLKRLKNCVGGISIPVKVSNIGSKYTSEFADLFADKIFVSNLKDFILPVTTLIQSISIYPFLNVPDDSINDLVKFSVISLELVVYLLTSGEDHFNVSCIDSTIKCTDVIFKDTKLSAVLNCDENISWLCSSVNCIYRLIEHLLVDNEPLPSVPKYRLAEVIDDVRTKPAGQACHRLLSVVNSYLLVPLKVWKAGWKPELSGTFNTQVPPLPIDLLQETDILEEFIFRITLLGWKTRQQFEETWMCLLSVLCQSPAENAEPADVGELVHASSLAVRAITSLLLKTLAFPIPGNSNVSSIVHISRDLDISCKNVSLKKLKNLHDVLQYKYEECTFSETQRNINVFICSNFEKHNKGYSYGQVSVRYFMIATKIVEDVDEHCRASTVYKTRERILEEYGLDVNSCIQFLLDFYTQLMKPPSVTMLRLLHETVRSTVIISDLFTDKYQFTWMLDIFLELSRIHSIEDELFHQYLILGICKATAVVTPDMETYENIKKLLIQYMKSSFLPLRISCLYGILYILESCRLTNTRICGVSDELQLILPFVVEYLQGHFSNPNRIMVQSEEHTLLVWSITFYLLENVDEVHIEPTFYKNMLQQAVTILSKTKHNTNLHFALMKALERLILVKSSVLQKIGKQILKLSLEKMKSDNSLVALQGIQLLLTYMYTDCAQYLESAEKSPVIQTNPDYLVQTIEKVSAIFECIKKGHLCEVEVLSAVLPYVLNDFFSPADILTKVIGEFLSPQQQHPRLLSRVVFQVFESAINQRQLSLLQDWVVFSLPNFTQAFSVGMATWCLTCFFISASSNDWIRWIFPYVQARVGRYEYEDRKMLCIAASDFYRNLKNDKQKQTFVDNFKKVRNQVDMPFSDLLLSL